MAVIDSIDVYPLKRQAKILGNGAHELRNILAMTKKAELPELIAIDTLAAQVENQSRQFVQTYLNSQNLLKPETGKNLLRAIYRTNNFILRNLTLQQKELGYSLMSAELLKQLIDNVQLQQKIVKNLDSILNQTFLNFLDEFSNVNIIVGEQFSDNKLFESLDFSKQQIPLKIDVNDMNMEYLIESARTTCNQAHDIQNLICTYQVIEKVQVPANQINNIAGKIENQFRAILLSFGQQQNSLETVKKTILKQVKAAREQITAIAPFQKEISEFYPKDMKCMQGICDAISTSLSFFQIVAETKIDSILKP